jgi:endonuclease YncB( thermonuclease family)
MRRTALKISGFILTALTTVVLLLLYQAWGDRPAAGDGGAGETAQVTEVLSTTELRLGTGDVLTLGGIEAPPAGEPFAEEGRQAARALAEGKQVRIEGPAAASYLYLPDGQLLQALLIAGGYARVAPDAPTDAAGESLRLAQFEAQANNLGIWTGQPRVPLPTPRATLELACTAAMVPNSLDGAEAEAHLGERQTVVFAPTRTVQRSNGITLLGEGGNEGFGVVIPTALLGSAGNIAPEFLERCVVVTGLIERDIAGSGARITVQRREELIVLR